MVNHAAIASALVVFIAAAVSADVTLKQFKQRTGGNKINKR